MVKYLNESDQLDLVFGALADSTRRAILAKLLVGEASVTELASPFQMSLPAITKHLKVLEKAGLISRGKQAQWRPCQIKTKPLQEVNLWLDQYRKFWEARLDGLDQYLKDLQSEEKKNE